MKKNNKKYNQKSKYTLTENSLNNTNKRNWWFIYIIIAFVVPVLLYVQTINFKFTNFDDDLIISNNINFLSDFKNANKTFQTDAYAVTNSTFINNGSVYRPLQTLSYMIDIQLSGVNKTSMYHLTNVLLIGLISCLIFILLGRFLIQPKLALIGTLFYCVHPLFVSSVTWIPARGDLLLTLFSLLSFIFLIDFVHKRKLIYLFLNWIAFTIALFCKETAAVLPLLFIIYYFTYSTEKKFDIKYLFNIILYVISGVFWLWLRSKAVGNISNSNDSIGIMSILLNLRTIPESLIKFFIPIDNNPLPCFTILKTIAGLGVIVIMIIIFIKNKERSRKENIFCFAWFLVLMLPPMLLKPVHLDYLDHRFLLPLTGILLFVLFNIPKKWIESKDIKKYLLLLVIFVLLSSFTFIKSRPYSDPMSFYNHAISQNNNSAFAFNNRGTIKNESGDFAGAISDYDNAIAIDSNDAKAFYNRGLAKENKGDKLSAIEDYNKAVELNPNYSEAYNNRGLLKFNMGEKLGVIDDYNKAIAINPNYAEPYYNRGIAKAEMNDQSGAIVDFNKAIAINPKSSNTFNNRGIAKVNMNDLSGAVLDYNKAISINPNDADIYINRGIAKAKMGDKLNAIEDFSKAIEINPQLVNAYFYRAINKYGLKDLSGTIEDCDNALKLNPDYGDALNLKAQAKQELQKTR